MRKIYIVCLLAVGAISYSCERDLPTKLEYQSYQFDGLDEDAGTWKTILNVSEITVPAPAATNSAGYQEEINKLKADQQKLTKAQKEAITHWTSNPTTRWNEVVIELIAKYNLIPGPNEDNTYTLPTAANPAGPPLFPFAHPPYSSRAMAYMSVAQFDGLVVAWKYKYQHRRPAPYKVDAAVSHAYEDTDLPSYPSEGAVIAEASRAILSVMFPNEVQYIQSVADEHLESIRLSGSAVQSDLDAGIKIGKEVAAIALQRASGDGMSRAQTPKPVSDSIKNAAFQRFGWAWDNQEIPVRPVGLTPAFGNVKPWNVPNVELVRPGPPPALDSKEVQDDFKLLKNYADNMNDMYRRIANYWEDGLGKWTPGGHWNNIVKGYIVKSKMNPIRSARVFAYLNTAIQDAGIACWDAKYYYHYPRPIQLIKGFQTIVGTPNFPAYTSGHSVFSGAAGDVIAYFFPSEAVKMKAWAEEAAQSRVYAGIHWSFDATAGTIQGKKVAEYAIDRARADGAD